MNHKIEGKISAWKLEFRAKAAKPWFTAKFSLGWQGWLHSPTCLIRLREMQTRHPVGWDTNSCQILALLPPSLFSEKDSVGFQLQSAAHDPVTNRNTHPKAQAHRGTHTTCLSHRRHYQLESEEPRSKYTTSQYWRLGLFPSKIHCDTFTAPKIYSSEKPPHQIWTPNTAVSSV